MGERWQRGVQVWLRLRLSGAWLEAGVRTGTRIAEEVHPCLFAVCIGRLGEGVRGSGAVRMGWMHRGISGGSGVVARACELVAQTGGALREYSPAVHNGKRTVAVKSNACVADIGLVGGR